MGLLQGADPNPPYVSSVLKWRVLQDFVRLSMNVWSLQRYFSFSKRILFSFKHWNFRHGCVKLFAILPEKGFVC